jgi:hypothetical protein
MGVWCKLVFLGGRGRVVPAALVGFAVVFVASSSSALAPSSKAFSSPVVRGSASVIVVHCAVAILVRESRDTNLRGSRYCTVCRSIGSRKVGSGDSSNQYVVRSIRFSRSIASSFDRFSVLNVVGFQ